MTIIAVQGLLQVTPINAETGFIQIKLRKVEIVNQTNTIIHIINPLEILNITNQLEKHIDETQINNKNILKNEIQNIRAKIQTITPSNGMRKRRGLINGIGKIYKWLFGTMDDEDRKDILKHLQIIHINTHNTITNINKQIYINTHFNDSITNLKNTINKDINILQESYTNITKANSNINKNLCYLDYMIKLKTLENKINEIQSNIASAKQKIIHPGILTIIEIQMFKIYFYKLKLAKLGIMQYEDNQLIIAIKIPNNYLTADLNLIKPLPSTHFLEIDSQDEYIVKIENKTFTYTPDVTY